jgi:hypothetical protein
VVLCGPSAAGCVSAGDESCGQFLGIAVQQ